MFSEVLESKVQSELQIINDNDIKVQYMFNDSIQVDDLNYSNNRQIEIPSDQI